MIGFGSLAKMAKGGGPEQLAGLLKALGVEVSMSPVEGGAAAREGFTALAGSASLPGAKLLRLQGKMKDGTKLDALLVVNS